MRAVALLSLLLCLTLTLGSSGGGCSSHLPRLAVGPETVTPESPKPEEPQSQRDKAREKLDSAANAVGWLAGLCALASLGTLILSFLVPIIPTKTSAACFAASLVGYALQYLLLVYGVLFAEVAIWLGVLTLGVIGASVLIPWAIATVNYLQARTGTKLITEAKAEGNVADVRAGVALIANAKSLTPDERKELLTKVVTA